MQQRVYIQRKHSSLRIHPYTYLLFLYFLIAPMEDLLTSSLGSFARYLGLAIVAAGIMMNRGKIKIKLHEGDKAIIYLMGLGLVSCIWAANKSIAIDRNITYLLLPAICLYVGSLQFTKKEYELIHWAAILGGTLTAAYLLATGKLGMSGEIRLELTARNDPNNFAALLLLPFAYSIKFFFENKGISKWFCLLNAAVMCYVIFLTGSRGGMLSLFLLLAAYFFLSKAYRRLGVLLGVAVLLVIGWYVIVPRLPQYIIWRLFGAESYATQSTTAGNRSDIWRTIISKILPQMNPLGYGAGCGPVALSTFYHYLKGVHNTYLNMILEYGVFGIPAFLYMLWQKLRGQWKEKNLLEVSLLIAICAIIFFLDSYAKKFFWNILILYAIGRGIAEDGKTA